MVIAEIATGLTGLKTALDILKGLKKANTSGPILSEIADLQSALIEVQQDILAANETHATDIDRIRGLEAEVAELKAWNDEKERYDLVSLPPGAFAYALKPTMAEGEPIHWLCANCYEDRKKSLLQRRQWVSSCYEWGCHSCSGSIRVAEDIEPSL